MENDVGREFLQYLDDEIDWMPSFLVWIPLVQKES